MTAKIESSKATNESLKLYFLFSFFLKKAVISIILIQKPFTSVDPTKVAVINDFTKVYIVQSVPIDQ